MTLDNIEYGYSPYFREEKAERISDTIVNIFGWIIVCFILIQVIVENG